MAGAVALATALVGAGGAHATPVEVSDMRAISAEPAYVAPCTAVPFGTFEPEGEFQPHMAVDPRDARRIAVVWTQGVFLSSVVGVSDDGGRTWTQSHVPISRCSGGLGGFAADPWLAWGPDGTLHLAAITGTADFIVAFAQAAVTGDSPSRIVLTRSADGGVTWSQPVVAVEDGRHHDRESLAVDPTDPSRLHLTWTVTLGPKRFGTGYATSADGGASWSEPRVIHEGPLGWHVNGHTLRALADRTLLAFFYDQEPVAPRYRSRETVMRSIDGGATWTRRVIAETGGSWPHDPDSGTEVIGNAVPAVDIAPDGVVYAAWQDITVTDTGSTSTIEVSRSPNGGRTWTAPARLRSGPGEAWGPSLLAGPAGALTVTWYDTGADRPGDGAWTGEFRAAHVHTGAHGPWHKARIGDSFDLLAGLRSGPGGPLALGNYFGLAAVDGGVGAAFSLPGAQEAPQDIVFARLGTP